MKIFSAAAAAEIFQQIPFDAPVLSADKPFRFHLHIFLPTLYNKGWPKQAETRFKKRDSSNLVKVVEDLVSRSIGIDDSCFVSHRLEKYNGPDYGFEGMVVFLEELEDR